MCNIIDGSQKCKRLELAFELQSLCVIENYSKFPSKYFGNRYQYMIQTLL